MSANSFHRNLGVLLAGLLVITMPGATPTFAYGTGGSGGSGGAGGGAGGGGAGGGGGGFNFVAPSAVAPTPDVDISVATEQAMAALDNCHVTGSAARDCVADILNTYAASIERAAPKMPAKVRAAVAEIRHVAKAVASAKSTLRAVAAIKTVVAKIQSGLYIALVKADDPDSASARNNALHKISDVLAHAAVTLSRSTEI